MKKFILLLLLPLLVFSADKGRETFKEGVELANQGRYDEAIVKLKQVLDYGSLNADAHLNLAIVFANKNDYDSAVKEAELAATARPDSLTTQYLLGMLYEKKNN
ncbi:MAG: tetratricopeptide repeat protein, partial [Candidatus Firestonebacteria bacterium]